MSTNPKPYYDDVKTRSMLLKTIEVCQDNGSLDTKGDGLGRDCAAMYTFYRSPAPLGYEYTLDVEWVSGKDFALSYSKLKKLLYETIVSAKTEKTKNKRRLEALALATEIWKRGYGVDKETNKIPTRRIAPTT